jgi:hypothetical protein
MKRWLLVSLFLVGCTTQNSRWGNPALFGGTGTSDSYQCYRESKQEIGFGEFASSAQAAAQRLYDLCMQSKGHSPITRGGKQ